MDKRKFLSSICVRNDTIFTRIELCPAENYDGEKGSYRVRVNRKWHDINGKIAFFDKEKISKIITGILSGSVQEIPTSPDIPTGSRVSFNSSSDNNPNWQGGITGTPPILDYNGIWKVYIILYGKSAFIPCDKIKIIRRKHAR